MGIYFNEIGKIHLNDKYPIIGAPVSHGIIDWWKLDEDVIGEFNGYTGTTGGSFIDSKYLDISNSTLNVLDSFPLNTGDWSYSFFIKGGDFLTSLETTSNSAHTDTIFKFEPTVWNVNGQPVRAHVIQYNIIEYWVRQADVDWNNWTHWTWQLVFNGINNGYLFCYRNGIQITSAPFYRDYEKWMPRDFTGFLWSGTSCIRDIILYDRNLNVDEILYNYNALK